MKDIPECDCCMAQGIKLTKYKESGRTLCKLCANTLADYVHRRAYGSEECHIMQTICYVGNEILKELRKRP